MESRPRNDEGAPEERSAWPTALDSSLNGVASTVVTIGRGFGDRRSLTLNRVPGNDEESEGFSLTNTSERYEHIRLIGRGGMGQVDQVWDHDLMRKLAVKRLHPERADLDMALRQFLWEARVTAYLDHPNIIPVHDLGINPQGELYFTMKFVHGTSLDELLLALARVKQATAAGRAPDAVDEVISAEHLTQLRRVRLFLDLCQAIAYAHQRGVLHRDLKPANVMLGQYGEVIIMDWGLAYPLPGPAGEGLRELLPDQLHTGTSKAPTGTPRYMSPEQVAGRSLDARSDVYALGVILYELLTLRSPYTATDFTRLMIQVSEGDVLPLSQTGPRVPNTLADVVKRAMALDPCERYASVSELTDDIESVLDGVVTSPSASSTTIQLIDPEFEYDEASAPPSPGLLIGLGAAIALIVASLVPSLLAAVGWVGTLVFALLAVGLGFFSFRARFAPAPD